MTIEDSMSSKRIAESLARRSESVWLIERLMKSKVYENLRDSDGKRNGGLCSQILKDVLLGDLNFVL